MNKLIDFDSQLHLSSQNEDDIMHIRARLIINLNENGVGNCEIIPDTLETYA